LAFDLPGAVAGFGQLEGEIIMKTSLTIAVGVCGAVLLTACSPAEQTTNPGAAAPAVVDSQNAGSSVAASADAYVYEAGLDVFGYYIPTDGVVFNGWSLNHVFIGDPMMFDEFAAGGEMPDEVPVWVEFWDTSSEYLTNEMGQEYASNSRRVRASSFVIESGRFDFNGSDEVLGDVMISGMIHLDRLGDPSGPPAFTGGMEVGGDRIRNASMLHYLGD
tara:strand:+ start:59796 stop:60449 length:654 start_codon:yes stop_codon:yes gene_type:complete